MRHPKHSMKQPQPEKPANLRLRIRDFFSALKNVPWAFSMLWEADSKSAVAKGVLTLISAALPISQAWITKLIIDGVLGCVHRGLSPRAGLKIVLPYILAEFALILAGNIISKTSAFFDTLLEHRLSHLINMRIIRKALKIEARYFEDADFYDKLRNARNQSDYRIKEIVDSGFSFVQQSLTLISFLAVLFVFSPWIAASLFAAAVPAFIVQSNYNRRNYDLQTARANESRRMFYLEQLLTVDTAVKEVKLFRLGEPLLERYVALFRKQFDEDVKLFRSRSIADLFWGLLTTLSYYAAYGWVIYLTLSGRTTLGQMTLYTLLFRQSQDSFKGILSNINSLYSNGLFLNNLFSFLTIKSEVHVLDQSQRPAEDPKQGIEFQNVWFQYAGNDQWVLQDISLKIDPSKKLALVGENGAGKTTLIKLLTRLYEPTRGKILFRGIDLKYFSHEELHRRISAIFQDFVRYQMPLNENVGFGSIENAEDHARIEAAAIKSGADEVSRAMPNGYQTMLGNWFDPSQELSGGQWQKIALGRAFMGDGDVLILDEPTASLDATAEYDIFKRFKELAKDKIAILVSHRFSTVRMADQIAVLKNGKIAELGSHEELVSRGGTYATLFDIQAQGYR